jgi:hypothetical protein
MVTQEIFWKQNRTRYVWNSIQNTRYSHYWRSVWGSKDNERRKSLRTGKDLLKRATNSSWRNWYDGSRPFFWRCSKEYRGGIRNGIPLWYRVTPPIYFKPQQNENGTEKKIWMRQKLCTVLERRYFIYGLVLSQTSFVAVLKGETYIRMMYNGSSLGLNRHFWVPGFALPTTLILLRSMKGGT